MKVEKRPPPEHRDEDNQAGWNRPSVDYRHLKRNSFLRREGMLDTGGGTGARSADASEARSWLRSRLTSYQ